MKTADEQYDEYVADRHRHHVAIMQAKMRAGDRKIGQEVDGLLGVKLADSETWLNMLFAEARGENYMQALIDSVVSKLAEVEAYKDGEAYERAIRQEQSERIADGLLKASFTCWPRPVWYGDEK